MPKLLLLVAFLALGLVLIFWHSSMPAESLSAGAVISASTSGAEDALRSAEPQQRNDGVIIYAYQQPGWMSDGKQRPKPQCVGFILDLKILK